MRSFKVNDFGDIGGEENRLWRRIIEARWGEHLHGNNNGRIKIPHGRGLRRKILMLRKLFQQCINWKIGRGNSIKFWEDDWVGNRCLRWSFLRIFNIAQTTKMTVEEAYRVLNGNIVCCINLKRNLNDWEIEEFEDLLKCLEAQLISDRNDQVVWKLEKNGKFSVSSFYNYLCDMGAVNRLVFPVKLI